jgi:hypothetical protein
MHASDLIETFVQGGALQDHIIRFTSELDPNGPAGGFRWPKYTADNPNQVVFSDSAIEQQTVDQDIYRQAQMDFLNLLSMNAAN